MVFNITANSTIMFIQSTISQFSTKILISLIILFVGFIFGRILSKVMLKGLKKLGLNNIIKEAIGRKVLLEETISHLVLYLVYFISIVMALGHLNIATSILNIISIVVMVLIVIFIILGVKDFIPNMISGIILLKRSTIKEEDNIIVDDISGTVKEITLLDTRLLTKSGDVIIIPNSQLTKKKIIKKRIPNSKKG